MQAVRILKVDVKYAGTKEANSSRVSLSLVCVWACDCVCATPSFFKIVVSLCHLVLQLPVVLVQAISSTRRT